MTHPLIQTGPGGAYSIQYLANGSRLVALAAAPDGLESASARRDAGSNGAGGNGASPGRRRASADVRSDSHDARAGLDIVVSSRHSTLLDRLLGIDRVEISARALVAERVANQGDASLSAVTQAAATQVDAVWHAARSWLNGQHTAIRRVAEVLATLRRLAAGHPQVQAQPAFASGPAALARRVRPIHPDQSGVHA
jgi:hypothetical protein